jgi:hypothetical protein
MKNTENALIIVANCGTPTEAQLIKNMLKTVDIHAFIDQANLMQGNGFLGGSAVGSVNVLVAKADLEGAQEVMRDFNRGQFLLEGETLEQAIQYKILDRPVFSPNAALVWSFLLTPAFYFSLHICNLKALGRTQELFRAKLSLYFFILLSLLGMGFLFSQSPSWAVPIHVSLSFSFITLILYLFSSDKQSGILIKEYGVHYPRRSLFKFAFSSLLMMILAGVVVNAILEHVN